MSTEKRLIDANTLSDKVDESKRNNPHPQGMIRANHRNEHDHFLRMIHDAPTVDAVEEVHGRWEHLGGDEWCCSACGEVTTTEGSWEKPSKKYCYECGAKMDGDGDDN